MRSENHASRPLLRKNTEKMATRMAGAVATTIAFHYNAPERSLTQEEVNQRHQALAGDLERKFAVERPSGAAEKR